MRIASRNEEKETKERPNVDEWACVFFLTIHNGYIPFIIFSFPFFSPKNTLNKSLFFFFIVCVGVVLTIYASLDLFCVFLNNMETLKNITISKLNEITIGTEICVYALITAIFAPLEIADVLTMNM